MLGYVGSFDFRQACAGSMRRVFSDSWRFCGIKMLGFGVIYCVHKEFRVSGFDAEGMG